MSVKLYVGGKPAYIFLSRESAEEFVARQKQSVKDRWPMVIRNIRQNTEESKDA